jgi:mono/diheme cytochrome c family protein
MDTHAAMKHLLLSLLIALAGGAAASAELTAEQVAKGQQLYTTGCLNCHPKKGGTIHPKAMTDAKWGRWLDKMMPMSKLQGDDRKLLTEYLAAVRLDKAELPKASASAHKNK